MPHVAGSKYVEGLYQSMPLSKQLFRNPRKNGPTENELKQSDTFGKYAAISEAAAAVIKFKKSHQFNHVFEALPK